MKALAVNCTLKSGSAESSTELLLSQVLEELRKHDVEGDLLRVADLNIKPGGTSDEGDGDDWPSIRAKIMESEILVLGTPIWLGQPSSIAKRVLERMDAFLHEADERGRYPSYGKVGLVAVVGNEDGAHHVSAELFQALNEVGFSIAASAVTYWVGEAMQATDYKDLDQTPEKTQRQPRCPSATRSTWRGSSLARAIRESTRRVSRSRISAGSQLGIAMVLARLEQGFPSTRVFLFREATDGERRNDQDDPADHAVNGGRRRMVQ